MSGARLVPPLIFIAAPHCVREGGVILVPCCLVEAGGTRVLFADLMAMRPTVIPAVRVSSDVTRRARSPRSASRAGTSLVGHVLACNTGACWYAATACPRREDLRCSS